ncbi:MAG: hypothetical protein H6841_09680 [Planctomycetes bacterium]|nr:hypothetical protein [Planctomycetota bacterium]MCB9935401.1 hypothetical protein [Planctomycetota bacterium]
MDTLVIVRKIREAEALADAGQHGDARRLLEPLLDDDGLTDTHRKLVSKKLELFEKQQQRMTRMISRRGTSAGVRSESDQSSERTSIRAAVADKSERPTDRSIDREDRSERPTDLSIEKENRGAATEVVPKARNVDTEVPEKGHKLKVEPRKNSGQSSGMWRAIEERREVLRPPDPSDSQELAPVVDSDRFESVSDNDDHDPRKTDIFLSPPAVSDVMVQVAPDEDSAPVIRRIDLDKPAPGKPQDTPAPWNDTPVPQAAAAGATPAGTKAPAKPPVQVRDSFVIPEADTVMVPALPEKEDDSTYIMADDYFAAHSSPRNRRERSNPELKALADRLPDDDLRRELALEVVKLREQVEALSRESKRETRAGSRKIEREDRPASGSFHIPASQVNTIVRRAAGTDQIEVHMPGRDEEASELQVLRRDSVRGEKAPAKPTDRIALAQDYIDAAQIAKPGLLKPLATWLGVLVVLGVIGWAVHLGWRSISGAGPRNIEISANAVGDYRLGSSKAVYPDIAKKQNLMTSAVLNERGWLVQYEDGTDLLTAVSIPGPALTETASSGFSALQISFNSDLLVMDGDASVEAVRERFGGPTPPFSQAVWDSAETYILSFLSRQGDRVLEFCYATGNPATPLWIRLVDGTKAPKQPTRDDFVIE